MILQKSSISKFLEQVLDIYKLIANEGVKGVITDRIVFLEDLLDNNKSFTDLKPDIHLKIFLVILDAQALLGASFNFDSFSLTETDLLGIEDLKNTTKIRQRNWFMQMRIQSWLHYKGSPRLHDLVKDVEHSVCEYRFESSLDEYLVECKNLHDGGSRRTNVLSEKILTKIEKNQLGKAEKRFGISATKIMFIDISEYTNQRLVESNSFEIQVYSPDKKFLESIWEYIEDYAFDLPNVDIDSIVIVWVEQYFYKGQPIVYMYNAKNFGDHNEFSFDGLSLEMFPMKGKNTVFSELRFRTGVLNRSYAAELKTTLNNLLSPETFYSVGVEEKNN